MTNYSVIRLQGSQYKVSEGEEILVDFLNGERPKAEVLLKVKDGKVFLGKPFVKNAKVQLKVLVNKEKGKKLKILKFKAKSRYRRRMGFRALYTKLLVEKIS